ncbi:uncharacterized protein EDB93DRAFT_1109541 [Suillus bovinus]|uniref:uncharacterized protein n=1 Tax=Suillus bovinus TaxID=48563 RepID=UPI001B8808C7|nr:uncharacterized protein EDB93DRAFT_1109541 [Suillus bovinus]KAG2126881.1 hypothetical protein EDB93DRAFT_1109541 [Suillus bovinus]
MSEFEKFIHPSVDDIFTSEPTVIVIASGGCKQQSSPFGSDQALQSRAAIGDHCKTPTTLMWMGETAIPNKLWQLDRVMTCCIFHYQHWLDGIENDGLTIPEQVDHTSVPSLMGLRWIRECLLTLLEEQREGIRDKMAEIQIYTAILDRLKRGRGE